MDVRARSCTGVHETDPVVVIGTGPAGARLVNEIVRREPGRRVVWFGDEPWMPYNRIKLSSLLAGEMTWDALVGSQTGAAATPDSVSCRFGERIAAIDCDRCEVIDSHGEAQPFSCVVLATGSRAHVPQIPGVSLNGVFTFRDLNDAQRLQARLVRSRVTVVIGGGLLGLEAARAVRRFRTEVWVIEQEARLMPRQLDDAAARALQEQVEAMGLRIRLSEGVREIFGDGRVEGVRLRDGSVLECDTVIVATGIRPNTELAIAAGLPVGLGVRVDDRMRTSDPRVFAIGECAEHRGIVYGLVAPGLEQAAVAACSVAGTTASYDGTVAATNLKVMGCSVFSIGEIARRGLGDPAREIAWQSDGAYRKVILRHGRMVGAIGIGEWPERSRIQEAVRRNRLVWPWERRRFARDGALWDDDASDVSLWPADATICNCTGVTKGRLEVARREGCRSVTALSQVTGAGTVCGSCRPLLAELAGAAGVEPLTAWRALAGVTMLAGLLALIYALVSIPFPVTTDVAWRWDVIWRDKDIKEYSGYSVLALMALLAVISLRKRWSRIRAWNFDYWRLVHVVAGGLLVGALFFHSGGRLGYSVDLVLSVSVIVAMLTGVVIAGALAKQHVLAPRLLRRVQRTATLAHIVSLWLIPALLGFHIFKTYYF